MMMITPTQELLKAEKHIDNQDYDTAREILSKLDHPTAKEWLVKLDVIAPVKPNKLAFSCGILYWCVLLIIGFFAVCFFALTLIRIGHLYITGLPTEGIIIERFSKGRVHEIVYTFEVGDKTFISKKDVPLWFYDDILEDTTVIIRYDGNDPNLSTIKGSEEPLLWIFSTLFFLPMMGYFLYRLYRLFQEIMPPSRKKKYMVIESA